MTAVSDMAKFPAWRAMGTMFLFCSFGVKAACLLSAAKFKRRWIVGNRRHKKAPADARAFEELGF
jgi:hypothetical protein